MQSDIEFGPAYAMATISLADGESVTVEAGSMVGMTDGMQIKTHIGGTKSGFFGAIFNFFLAFFRKFLGGESFFLAEYSGREGGRLALSPKLPGAVVHRRLDGGRLTLTGGSFLAATPGIHECSGMPPAFASAAARKQT